MDELVELVQELGDTPFATFVQEASRRLLRANFWLRAKHLGLVTTYIDEEGVLHIAPGEQSTTRKAKK